MDFNATFRDLIARWPQFIFIGIRVVFIAIVFEVLAWWLGRRIERMATPFLGLDEGRDPKWRSIRRAALRQTPRMVLRSVLYTMALILVFDAFGLQILPLSLSIGAVALLFGAAFLPLMRDYSQGYALLSEDTLAPGDAVEIGLHQGIVEKWTLRATWLRDNNGRLHVLSNRDIHDVIIHRRAAAEVAAVSFDPLSPLPAKPPRRKAP